MVKLVYRNACVELLELGSRQQSLETIVSMLPSGQSKEENRINYMEFGVLQIKQK